MSAPSRTVAELAADGQELLFRAARTANTFSGEPVDEEQLRAIYDLVRWAPTSANCQPMRIVAVRTAQARERLLAHLAPGNQDKTRSAPLTLILTADTDFHEHLPRVFPIAPDMKENFADPEARIPVARFNAALQIGYLILGIRAIGLAAGPMSGFDDAGLDAEFFAGTPHRSLLVVNVGKPGPDAWFGRLPRLDYDEVVTVV